ncbi:MAG: hypothetical protein R3B95_12855 [Nitrospirales bacterium]|nr:hypothetical protein [Nitrospirales bacterium]
MKDRYTGWRIYGKRASPWPSSHVVRIGGAKSRGQAVEGVQHDDVRLKRSH